MFDHGVYGGEAGCFGAGEIGAPFIRLRGPCRVRIEAAIECGQLIMKGKDEVPSEILPSPIRGLRRWFLDLRRNRRDRVTGRSGSFPEGETSQRDRVARAFVAIIHLTVTGVGQDDRSVLRASTGISRDPLLETDLAFARGQQS